MNDKKFIILSSIFFLLFIFGMGTLLIQDPLSNYIKATSATTSGEKSFLTALPQVSSAGSEVTPEKIKVTVYIRSENGDLLAQKTVKLSTDLPTVNIEPSDSQVTDKDGKVEFNLTSSGAGTAQLTAVETGSGVTVKNTVSVKFTQ